MNKILLVGRIGQKPELGDATNGKQTCRASLATKSWKKGDDGKNLSEWHDLRIFGDNAKRFADWCGVGALVAIEGSLSYWEGEKDGAKFKRAQIVVDRFEKLMDGKSSAEPAAEPQKHRTVSADNNEELPF